MNATYITIDDTHRIEVMPGGNCYPQHLVNNQIIESWAWGYFKKGNKQQCFSTEKGARKFIARQMIGYTI